MNTPCRTLDPDTWFEGTPGYDPSLAVAACCACPLINPCLRIAMKAETTSTRHGIFGGLFPEQRAKLANKDARNQPVRRTA